MGRRGNQENKEVLKGEVIPEELQQPEASNLENNIEVIDELKVFVEKFPDMKFGQLLYNITPEGCITMGDLINLDAKDVLKTLKVIRRKKLKDEVTYG